MKNAEFNKLFALVRADSSPSTWSKGVELARAKRVIGLLDSDDEARFRVELPDTRVAPELSLFPGDEDWVCSCKDSENPCSHVAAAVIAQKRAFESGEQLPKSGNTAHVRYQFEIRGELLAFRRFLVQSDGSEQPFWGDLTALAAGKREGPRVAATDMDLQVDRAMAEVNAPELPARVMERILLLLRGRDDIKLDSDPIPIISEPVAPWLVLKMIERRLHIVCKADPRAMVIFKNGAVLTTSGLQPVKRVQFDAAQNRYLNKETILEGEEVVGFIAKDLPLLRKQLHVEGDDQLTFTETKERPYIYLESWRDGDVLRIRPLIAYGKPIIGLVRGEQFEVMGSEVPTRRLDEERRLRDQFQKESGLELSRTYEYAGQRAVDFVRTMKHRHPIGGEGYDDFAVYGMLEPHVRLEGEEWHWEFSCAANTLPGDKVYQSWERGEGLVALPGGGFAELPQQWLEQYGAKIRAALAAQHAGAPKAALVTSVKQICDELAIGAPTWLGVEQARAKEVEGIVTPQLPSVFHAELRSYQSAGVLWLQKLRALGMGGLLCDDMGLGKTLQAIAVLKPPALVIAPKSLLSNWQKEIARFRPDLKICIYHGSERVKTDSDVVITTYHTLRQDIATFAAMRWEIAVFDESQILKNPDSQITRAAFQVNAAQKIGLTGTPIENRMEDLWSQMNLVVPGYLGPLNFFRKEVIPQVRAGNRDQQEGLKARLRPFILRRLKSEVGRDLPEKTEVLNLIELGEEQRQLYDATLAQAKEALGSGQDSVPHVLTALLRLRQACAHTELLDKGFGFEQPSAKVAWLLETLDDLRTAGNRSLLFSQWTSLLDLLEPSLRKLGIRFLRLDGQTKDRQAVVDEFSNGEYDLLIMSIKAGGVGLNLTVADHVFLFDPWWNPAVEAQAIDRAHRIGQQRPVFVHKLIALDTIEERVVALQQKKSELADLFVGEGMQDSQLGQKELLSLVFDG